MKQGIALRKFRDWLFNLLIDFLSNSGWIIIIRDFKNYKDNKTRDYLGLTDYYDEVIYLDKDEGTPKILVHEICHFAFGIVFESMARNLLWKDLKKVKGGSRMKKEFEWVELKTYDFENLFYSSLTKRQIKTLQGFIDEARTRYKEIQG